MNTRHLMALLVAMLLLLGACHKKPIPSPLPPPARRDEFQLAERMFDAGDYAAAARSYLQLLRQNPTPEKREKALFRLGLAYALPGSGIQQFPQSMMYFRQLLAVAPQSPLRTQVHAILALYAELEKTQADDRAKDAQIKILGGELEKTQAESRAKDARIKNLGEELEKLKQIDLQKRPPRPQ
jgi:tetratricopeptide (TPR) repeat protein